MNMKGREYDIYCAGLFDGEGAIYMSGHKSTSTVVLSVTNTNKKLCQIFYDCWDGRLHQYQQSNPNAQPIWRWFLHGKKAKVFLLAIQPYSIEKHPLIDLALQYIETINNTGWRARGLTNSILEDRKIISENIYLLNSTKGKRTYHSL